jgi:hypothetical protein
VFETIKYPPVGVGQLLARRKLRRRSAVHERKLRRVEQLVGEVAGGLRMILADRQVRSGIGSAGEGESQRVRTEAVHPVQWIDAVAA